MVKRYLAVFLAVALSVTSVNMVGITSYATGSVLDEQQEKSYDESVCEGTSDVENSEIGEGEKILQTEIEGQEDNIASTEMTEQSDAETTDSNLQSESVEETETIESDLQKESMEVETETIENESQSESMEETKENDLQKESTEVETEDNTQVDEVNIDDLVNEEILTVASSSYLDTLPLPALTGNKRIDAANIAYSQIGYKEGSNNLNAYGPQAPWCVYFARWCAMQAGLESDKWLYTGSTTELVEWFQNQSRWHDKVSYTWSYKGISGGGRIDTYVPQPGDFVAIENNSDSSDGPDHTGIVYKIDNSYVYVVEGNEGDEVRLYKYTINTLKRSDSSSINIVGLGEPDYGVDVYENYVPNVNIEVLEGGKGKIRIKGWAFDYDDTSAALEIRVYIGKDKNNITEGYYFSADLERTDVNNAYGVGNNHGFDATFDVKSRGTQNVYIYAVDIGENGGNEVEIGSGTVNIQNKEFSISYKDSILKSVPGNTFTFDFTFTGDGIYTIDYSVDDPSILTVKGITALDWTKGTATVQASAIKEGKTTVYMKLLDENNNVLYSKGIPVEITVSQPYSITFDDEVLETVVGETVYVDFSFKGDGIYKLDSSVDNQSMLRVDELQSIDWANGTATLKITALNPGLTSLYVKLLDKNLDELLVENLTVSITQPVTGVTLNKNSMALDVGETDKLTATILPSNSTSKAITWTSSNTSVATVSSGTVTAKGAGTATITVTTKDGGYTANCKVTVTQPVTGVTLNKTTATINVGETLTLTANVLPTSASNKKVTWGSSNTNIVTVSQGVITAKSEGTAVVKVSTDDGGYTASCSVTVNKPQTDTQPVTGIRLNKTSTTIKVGSKETLIATVLPENASNKTVLWASTDTNVATVQNGVVTAVAAGKTTITALTGSGFFMASCEITVIEDELEKPKIILSATSIELLVDTTYTLTAMVTPTDFDCDISWESSDESVAIVSNGEVTGKNPGKATIKVEIKDYNVSATCEVNVISEKEKIQEININKTNMSLNVGETDLLVISVVPSSIKDVPIEWTSTNEKVATVEQGLVTAVSKGNATIIATITEDENVFQMSCDVMVTELNEPEIWINNGVGKVGTSMYMSHDYDLKGQEAESIQWTSSDEEIVYIDKNTGLMQLLKAGKSTITLTVNGVSVSAQMIVVSIEFEKTEYLMNIGEEKILNVIVLPEELNYTNKTWTSSNEDVATVNNGIVTAHKEGTTIITYTYGEFDTVCTVSVREDSDADKEILIKEILLENSNIEMICDETFTLKYSIIPSNATDTEVLFLSENTNVATVDERGIITANNVGETNIIVVNVKSEITASCHVIVKEATSDGDNTDQNFEAPDGLWITGLEAPISYTGNAITQNISVYYGNTLLQEKSEYIITYKNNKNAGTAQIIVKGKGNYTGNTKATFEIKPIDILNNDDIVVNVDTAVETGKKLIPKVIVTWKGKKLRQNKDYLLSYNSNIVRAKDGGYDITIEGIGNYNGSIEQKFIVAEKGKTLIHKAKVSGIAKKYVYDEGMEVGPNLDAVVVKMGKYTLTKDKDYTIRLENNRYVGKGSIVIEAVDGSDYAGTKRIDFNIIGIDLKNAAIEFLNNEYVYNGEAIIPDIRVWSDKKRSGYVVPRDSYTISCKNNLNQGTAIITVTGIEEKGISGKVIAKYKINKLNINDNGIAVSMPNEIVYAKGGAQPKPVVTYTYNGKKRVLREGVDYALKYTGNNSTNGSKTPIMTISGLANFKGTITKKFDIDKQYISELNVILEDKAYKAGKTGKYYCVVPKIYDKDGKQLVVNKDFTVEYISLTTGDEIRKSDIINDGTKICAIITGKGNYQGISKVSYFVRKLNNISKAKVVKIKNQQYTGREITPNVNIYIKSEVGRINLIEGEDYEIVEYYNNIKKGTASILIKGINKYTGSRIITFKIVSANNRDIWKGIFDWKN